MEDTAQYEVLFDYYFGHFQAAEHIPWGWIIVLGFYGQSFRDRTDKEAPYTAGRIFQRAPLEFDYCVDTNGDTRAGTYAYTKDFTRMGLAAYREEYRPPNTDTALRNSLRTVHVFGGCTEDLSVAHETPGLHPDIVGSMNLATRPPPGRFQEHYLGKFFKGVRYRKAFPVEKRNPRALAMMSVFLELTSKGYVPYLRIGYHSVYGDRTLAIGLVGYSDQIDLPNGLVDSSVCVLYWVSHGFSVATAYPPPHKEPRNE